MKNKQEFDVGSTVRSSNNISVAPKPGPKRRSQGVGAVTVACRSTIATRPDKTGCVSLLQDDLAPVPLGSLENFLIAPMFNSVGEVRECEAQASNLMPLLAFEQDDHTEEITPSTNDMSALVIKYKNYGDQLLRLNDYTCAISYYEAALHFVSSKFGLVGGTLIVKEKGHCVIAELDCIENDEKNNPQYDVTFLSGQEGTIAQTEILLSVWEEDVTFLQPRILLNLSRCLLKLADVDTARGYPSCVGGNMSSGKKTRQVKYRQAAIMGASLAMALCDYHLLENSDDTAQLNSLVEKARLVRSRTFLDLRKLPNATVDVKKVLAKNAANREAQSLLADIKASIAFNKSVDKKLSKEVCKWVQTATSSSKSVSDKRTDELGPTQQSINERRIDQWQMTRNVSPDIFAAFVIIVAMWVFYTLH